MECSVHYYNFIRALLLLLNTFNCKYCWFQLFIQSTQAHQVDIDVKPLKSRAGDR